MHRPSPARQIEPLESRRLFSGTALPHPDHVVIVVEENHSHSQVIGSADAPYINSLAARGATFTDYHAVAHPSQPNYFALFSGSTAGVPDDTVPATPSHAPSLGGQLVKAGLGFAGYSEDLPYPGFTRASRGDYHRRHAPWITFRDVPWQASKPMRYFPRPGHYAALPAVSFVIPNLTNDMHNGTVKQGDDWLRQKLDPYVQWAQDHNSLLVVTWDEDDNDNESNRIPTVVVGAGVKPIATPTPYTHYSLLRTIEDMYGLSPLGQAADAAPISEIWRNAVEQNEIPPSADAFAFDASPRGNFGSLPIIDLKTRTDSAGANRDAFLKFDLASLPPGAIGSARLRFHARLSGDGRVATSVFAVADTTWSETALTWENRPALGASLGTTLVSTRQSFWYEVDVTAYLRAQRAAGHRWVTLALHNPQSSTPKITLDSRESADRPALVITPAD